MAQRTVHLFVFDTLSDWEPGYAIAGINNLAWQTQPGQYRVRTVGVSTTPVTTMGGITVVPDVALDALEPAASAMLILPGGTAWDEGQHRAAAEKARQFLTADVPVAAICGGTAGLARVGVLDDKRHTSNARDYLQATHYGGAAFYQDAPAVTDGNLITAAATAPIEFAYHIFKRLDLYNPETLEAWHALFTTGDSAYCTALMSASQKGRSGSY